MNEGQLGGVLQELVVGVVVLGNLDGDLVGLLVVTKDLERGQVVDDNVGTGLSDLLSVVGGTDTNDHGASTLTSGDTSWGILENDNLLGWILVTQSVSGVLVAHWMWLTLGDLFGSDEGVWSLDGQQLQPFGGQWQGTRCNNSPTLLVVWGILLGDLVERLDKLNGTWDGLSVVTESVRNSGFPSSHLFLNGVLWRPLGDNVKGSASVGSSDDLIWVDVRSGGTEVSPELGDGTGRVDKGTVTVEKSSVNLEDSWLLFDGHVVGWSSSGSNCERNTV